MSFVEQDDVFNVVESYMKDLISKLSDKEIINNEFVYLSYEQAMEKYGTDKPDLRYDMEMVDVADIFARSSNEIFSTIAQDTDKNRIKALKVSGGDNIFSKSQMKSFEKWVKQYGAQGLGYFQVKEDGLK
jgi:aspartyl-tRNA synthetase